LVTKINFSNFSDCKQHPLKLVRISIKEKILLVSIWESIIPKIYQEKNPTMGNMASCFSHHQKGHLISSHLLITPKNQQVSLNKLFCWFDIPCYHLKNIQIIIILQFLVSKTIFRFYRWMQVIIRFHEHRI
jgi:hypothetical protein